jgi:outer membrane protein TolC
MLHAAASAQFSPELEVGPGVGFTNSTSLLSQEIDIFGRVRRQAVAAQTEVEIQREKLRRTEAEASAKALISFSAYLAANEAVLNLNAALAASQELLAATQAQGKIGEAPELHITRAELSALRAAQMVKSAEADLLKAGAALNSLLSRPLDKPIRVGAWSLSTGESSSVPATVKIAQAKLAKAEADRNLARVSFRPRLVAGIAADVWSLDRNQINSNQLGFQVGLKMPLFNRGRKNSTIAAADAEISRARSELAAAERAAELDIQFAKTSLESANSVRMAFAGDIIPRGEKMLASMTSGYRKKLVTLLELLEAQQTMNQLRADKAQADNDMRLAQVALLLAQTAFPGQENN